MTDLLRRIDSSPLWVRALPFLVVLLLTQLQGRFGPASAFWMYAVKTLAGAALLLLWRKKITEMKWAFSPEALLVGILIFGVWVGLDGHYPPIPLASKEDGPGWNPFAVFGDDSPMAWMCVAIRIGGSTLMVPALEEVFYRSMLYRWIARPDFMNQALGVFAWKPFLVTSFLFGLAHHEWLAGIVCGLAYQWLVCRKKRLGDAMTAHAVTNLLLGIWVVWKGAWQFW